MKRFLALVAVVAVLSVTSSANAQCTSCKGGVCRVLAAPAKVVHAVVDKVAAARCENACPAKAECVVEKPACEKKAEPACAAACEPREKACRRHVLRKLLGKLRCRTRCCG